MSAARQWVADLWDGLRQDPRRDLLVALSVWAVLVPQALAYGELAGLRPTAGLYTAVAALLLYPLLGSSRYLHVGPESSLAILTAASIGPLAAGDPKRFAALAALLALMAAGFLVLGAAMRLGVVARLLSTPILTGYLAGSAVIIVASQLPKVLGVTASGGRWWQRVGHSLQALGSVNWWAVSIAVVTTMVVLALRRFAPAAPAFLVALTVATLAVAVGGLAAEHGVAVVGHVEPGVPVPALPSTSWRDTLRLLGPAASVALLVFASSMLTGSVLANRDKEQVSAPREFLGLAAACAGSGLMQGFPANASDSRSFVTADGGARSQLTGIAAAALTVITLLFLTPLFTDMPTAALGAVVIVTALSMIDIAVFKRLHRARVSDFVLAATTCAGVLVFGVLPGIGVGVLVSLLEVLRRTVLPPTAVLGEVSGSPTWRDVAEHDNVRLVPGLLVYRFDAPLFFANAEVFQHELTDLVNDSDPPISAVLVNAEGIIDLDVTGAEMLAKVVGDMRDRGVRMMFARVRTPVLRTLDRLDLLDEIGADALYLRVEDAVSALQPHPA